MTTVTGMTASRMMEIEASSVIDGDVIGDELILTRHDGQQINAGNVRGPQGIQGPVGQDLEIITAQPVLDVGLANQIRAGRQLSSGDFADIGLNTPLGLWNLSDLNDVSGNGRNLSNKGSVGFSTGINGLANTAALFSGSTGQVLYLPDTGVNDPFKLKSGTIGCWFRTAKRSTDQMLVTKVIAAGALTFSLSISSSNILQMVAGVTSSGVSGTSGIDYVATFGHTDVADGHWHFAVIIYDGLLNYMYLDGVLDTVSNQTAQLYASNGPLNIGGRAADGSNANAFPMFGRIDEVFISGDVLTEDQIRNLYCAKILHGFASTPKRVNLNVHRLRKGAAWIVGDFPTQPVRLYNFSAGSLNDEGSNNASVADTGGVGASAVVAGVDGTAKNALELVGALSTGGLTGTDTGLPSGTSTRTLACWFKTNMNPTNGGLVGYGQATTSSETGLDVVNGSIRSVANAGAINGPYCADSLWHFAVVVMDTAASDGLVHKLYLDGVLVGSNTSFGSMSLGGANHFRIGARCDGSNPFTGTIDGVFVCNYALTADQIITLYAKGSQDLGVSPINPGDYVERMNSTDLLVVFDTLDSQYKVDLAVG
jgi:Concanavalin A-like lectin/glucanases superfamily